MPKLVRLYIRHVFIGFALSAIFVSLLLWQNVGNLVHLIFTSDIGWIALVMMVVFNGIVFSGVQFAIAIMRMEGNNDTPPQRGLKIPLGAEPEPVVVKVAGPPRS